MAEQDILEVLIGQFHDDEQFAVLFFDAVQAEDERMTECLDALQGGEFLTGREVAAIIAVADELDGFEETAWRFAFRSSH